MKVLITGGAGTMGRNLVKHLLENHFEVRVLDVAPEKIADIKHSALEVIEGSITEPNTVKKALSDITIVYHLAETFSSDPYVVLDTDIKGNVNLLTASVAASIKHFLFISTHRVYGRPREIPLDEEHPQHPEESGRPVYGAAKVANEKLCLAWWHQHGLPVSIFRPWWSFYPHLRGKIIRNMIDTALKRETICIPDKSGGNFIHNNDAALCLRMATLKKETYGQVFNLHSGIYVTWRELAEMVVEVCESGNIKIIAQDEMAKDPLSGGDPSVYYECRMDDSKTVRIIGYCSQFEAEELKLQLREAIGQLVESRRTFSCK